MTCILKSIVHTILKIQLILDTIKLELSWVYICLVQCNTSQEIIATFRKSLRKFHLIQSPSHRSAHKKHNYRLIETRVTPHLFSGTYSHTPPFLLLLLFFLLFSSLPYIHTNIRVHKVIKKRGNSVYGSDANRYLSSNNRCG